MSKKIEVIKELQEELFVEEHGVTKEQARKLNEFIYWEPTGKEFDGWAGREIDRPSVSTMIGRLQGSIDDQRKRINELEWEHKKLWIGSTLFGIIAVGVVVTMILAHFRG